MTPPLTFPVVLGAYYGPAHKPTMWGCTVTARNEREYETCRRMLENSYPGATIVRKLPE